MDKEAVTVDQAEDRRVSITQAPNESPDQTIWQAVKQNPKTILASVAMTIGPLIYGFDNIIVGVVTAMPAFQLVFSLRAIGCGTVLLMAYS